MTDDLEHFRFAGRQFSRVWRRSKTYTYTEIKRLARQRACETRRHGDGLDVVNIKSQKVVAHFQKIRQAEAARRQAPGVQPERLRAFAALKQ